MIQGRCTLVFGVSGVGKSSSCSDFVARHPSYLHYSAGGLLREAKATSVDLLRTAGKQEITDNQTLIGDELRRKRRGQWNRPVIIDAHGVINNDVTLVPVPVAAIKTLEPDGLILLEARPELIIERRRKAARSRPMPSPAELQHEIEEERKAVRSFSANLGLPLVIDTVNDGYALDRAIAQLVQAEGSAK